MVRCGPGKSPHFPPPPKTPFLGGFGRFWAAAAPALGGPWADRGGVDHPPATHTRRFLGQNPGFMAGPSPRGPPGVSPAA